MCRQEVVPDILVQPVSHWVGDHAAACLLI
jgi:hypothetical protein